MFQLEPSRELEKCEQTEHALTGSETSSQPADEERREEVVVASTACPASHQEGQLYAQSAGGTHTSSTCIAHVFLLYISPRK